MNKIYLLILILFLLIILCKYFVESFQTSTSTQTTITTTSLPPTRDYYKERLLTSIKQLIRDNLDKDHEFLLKKNNDDNNNEYFYYDNEIYGYDEIQDIYSIDDKFKFKVNRIQSIFCDKNGKNCDNQQFMGNVSIYPMKTIPENDEIYLTLWDNNITIEKPNPQNKIKQIFYVDEAMDKEEEDEEKKCSKECDNGGICIWSRPPKEKGVCLKVGGCECDMTQPYKQYCKSLPINTEICWGGKTTEQKLDCEGKALSCNFSYKGGYHKNAICNEDSSTPSGLCTQ
jgi:hypothetical protein